MASVNRLEAMRSGSQVRRAFLTLWTVASLLTSCVAPSSDRATTAPATPEGFDLASPPSGWVRWQDDLHQVAAWLPGEWRHSEQLPGDDVVHPFAVFPPEDDKAYIWLATVKPVDFRADPRDPVISQLDGGNYQPESTYSVTVSDLTLPCARYLGGFRLVPPSRVIHICVLPGLPNRDEPYNYVLKMWVESQWEAELVPTWKLIVMSFALEQRPQVPQVTR
jgi:hypothetical protein